MTPHFNSETLRAHKRRNTLHTFAILGGIGALLMLSCYLIWGVGGLVVAALAIPLLYFTAPQIPPELVMRLYRGVEVRPTADHPVIDIVHRLAQRAELPAMPRLYVVPSMMLNAFAVGGRDDAVIAVTEGLLRRLDIREIAAVLAHETAHIKNNDLFVMGLADLMSRFTLFLSYAGAMLAFINLFMLMSTGEAHMSWLGILLLYLAPTISNLLQLGLSRAREYDADLEAAHLTGDPGSLARALIKLTNATGRFWEDLMFPVPGRRVPQPSILRSHPTTEDRVARLKQLAPTITEPPIVLSDRPLVSLVGLGPIAMRPRYRFPGLWY